MKAHEIIFNAAKYIEDGTHATIMTAIFHNVPKRETEFGMYHNSAEAQYAYTLVKEIYDVPYPNQFGDDMDHRVVALCLAAHIAKGEEQ